MIYKSIKKFMTKKITLYYNEKVHIIFFHKNIISKSFEVFKKVF
jgi:hypothetical protein